MMYPSGSFSCKWKNDRTQGAKRSTRLKKKKLNPFTSPDNESSPHASDNGINHCLRDVCYYGDISQEMEKMGWSNNYTIWGRVCFFEMFLRRYLAGYHGTAAGLNT